MIEELNPKISERTILYAVRNFNEISLNFQCRKPANETPYNLKAAKEIMGIIVGPKKDIEFSMFDENGYTALLWTAKHWIEGKIMRIYFFLPPLVINSLEKIFLYMEKKMNVNLSKFLGVKIF